MGTLCRAHACGGKKVEDRVKQPTTTGQPQWSSRIVFILATIGFSVGLGNIWRFPYLAGENGGGAFVLIYILCVVVIGAPIVIAELAMGRRGRGSPIATFGRLAKAAGKTDKWSIAGGFTMLTAFLIISFYCVIGGWTLHYIFLALTGALQSIDAAGADAAVNDLLASPWLLMMWQGIFVAINVVVLAQGVKGGLEKAVTVLMPLLFVLLTALAVYGLIVGDGAGTLKFLFAPDFSVVTAQTVLEAVGQAFFSVGVGMAAMMTYGAYLEKSVHIPRTAYVVALSDTAVALIAGLAVFPFVFAYGVEPGQGPGLVFVTLPTAFAGLGGSVAAIAFFGLLAVAALTSSIALFEVFVSWWHKGEGSRARSAVGVGAVAWVVGLGTVFSFNLASGVRPFAFIPGYGEATFFDGIDQFTGTIGLPLGGLLAAVFTGWVLGKADIAEELGISVDGLLFKGWRFLMRWALPLVILVMILAGIRE